MSGYQDLVTIPIDDFSEMLVSDMDTAECPLNGSPDTENFYCSRPGELEQRLGHTTYTNPGVNGTPDGIREFVDSQGGFHIAAWLNGNLYDWINNASVLIASGVYKSGTPVCFLVRDGIVYFSDGETFYLQGSDYVGVYTWDPTAATPAAPIGYTPGTGRMPAPACKAMCVYNASIVLGATRIQSTGAFEPHNIRWSNPIDPTVFLSTDAFVVGKGRGQEINSLQPFSIATEALSPADTLFVGKLREGIWGMKGALSALVEAIIPCEDGVMDGGSVQYLKLGDQSAVVVFLGTGKRFWATDGVSAREISTNIRKELYDFLTQRLLEFPTQRFSSVKNYSTCHYICDVGGFQYIMDWRTTKWTRFRGWPSGLWTEGENASRQRFIFCAYTSASAAMLSLCNSGIDDNGTPINAYWTVPDLKGGVGDGFANVGNLQQLKRFVECEIEFSTAGATITSTFTANRGTGDSASQTLVIANTNTVARYDTGLLYDSGQVYANNSVPTYTTYKQRLPIVKVDPLSLRRGSVSGYCMRAVFRQNAALGFIRIHAIQIKFQPRGGKRVASN